ncbi:MAG: ribosome biogenesis GTPase Der [Sedimentisphaerales bacterium]|nr:ribosome biogenesis GTPase Der [Sedimentisphaerales bacterium]
MALPVAAIVGRPNVGKSSLFNALSGRRISIVEPTAGVTRDRISAVVELDDKYFELVDTGGYGIEDHDNLTEHVEGQIQMALNSAQIVLFVVDIREGVTPLDMKVAQLLRKEKLKVLLVANKADSPKMENHTGELFSLGFGEPICVSALHGRNRAGLAEKVLQEISHLDTDKPTETVMKLAVVGRRNAGKSTFINCLAGEDRVIVSEVPGTTRDAVDVRFEKDGHSFIAIDTAGVRKKGKMSQNSIEFYSYTRALSSIRRADVIFLFLDAIAEISQVDKKLAHTISEEYKPCIIVVNKWDLAKDRSDTDQYTDYIDKLLTGLSFAPISFITASEGKNVKSLLDLARQLHKQSRTEVTTAQINKAIQAITSERTPSARRKVGLPKIYYGTQVAIAPPTLLLFVNHPDNIDENYRRFFVNRLRDLLPFSEVPIRLLFRGHHENQNSTES